MGVICPCGVKVHAVKENQFVKFKGRCAPMYGSLTYDGDVCSSAPEMATLTLTFDDKKTIGGLYSFTFRSTSITCISCREENGDCYITLKGVGMVGNKTYSFEAELMESGSYMEEDAIVSFVIKGFFFQKGVAEVPKESVHVLGC